ncbi:MAG TPA: TatD family hydrolase [Candidatus Cybelea sp.]
MIDTHCHVHDRAFDADRDEIVARAREAGVRAMVTIGEDLEDSARAVDAAQRYGLCAAVGIHPHEAAKAPADIEARLKPLLAQEAVVALGEIGLDYYYDHSPRDAQADVFKEQLRIGREFGAPIVFHQRDAFEDFTAALRVQWHAGMRGVVHCFTGTPGQARTYVDEFGLLLGIGGVLTFPKAQDVRDAVCEIGLRSIVLETDCPYLAPVPKRGKRNEPAYLTHTAAKLAELLNVPIGEVVAQTDANAATLFGI